MKPHPQHLAWPGYSPKSAYDVKYNYGTKDIFNSNGMKRMKVCDEEKLKEAEPA